MKINLPGVHGGISQQSPTLRLPNQHSSAENVIFDILNGAQGPRWGTEVKATHPSSVFPPRPRTSIKTTDGKLWFVEHKSPQGSTNGGIIAFYDAESDTKVEVTTAYTKDSDDLAFLPIMDTLMVINRKKEVGVGYPAVSAKGKYSTALVWVPQLYVGANIQLDAILRSSRPVYGLNAGDALRTASLSYVVQAGDTVESLTIKFRDMLHKVDARVNRSGAMARATLGLYGSIVAYEGTCYECMTTHTSTASAPPSSGSRWMYFSSDTGLYPDWQPEKVYLHASAFWRDGFELILTSSGTHPVSVSSAVVAPTPANPNYGSVPRFINEVEGQEGLPPYVGRLNMNTLVFRVEEGYYVTLNHGSVNYVECPAPGHEVYLDHATMPIEIKYNPTGTPKWALRSLQDDYMEGGRQAGDAKSAPDPDFVGKTITNAFFYRNRMCFLSDNYVAMSKVGQYYDWYPDTAAEVLDSDPIVVFPAYTKYSKLLWAIPFNKQLLLLSATKQYVLHSSFEALTPKTVVIDEATSYNLAPHIEPVVLPSSLLLPLNHDPFLGVLDYTLDDQEIASEGTLLSAHVPKFIPQDTTNILHIPSKSLILFFKAGSGFVQVYKYHKAEDGSLTQMAWGTWSLGGCEHMALLNSSTIVIFRYGGDVAHMDIGADDAEVPRLDDCRKILGVRDGDTIAVPSWGLIVDAVTFKEYTVIRGSQSDPEGILDTKGVTGPRDVWVGRPIGWRLELSPLILRDDNGLPRKDASLTIENIEIDWEGSPFQVTVGGKALPSRTQEVSSSAITSQKADMGGSLSEPNPTRILLMAPAKRATITVGSERGYRPTSINNISYNVDVTRDWG